MIIMGKKGNALTNRIDLGIEIFKCSVFLSSLIPDLSGTTQPIPEYLGNMIVISTWTGKGNVFYKMKIVSSEIVVLIELETISFHIKANFYGTN